MASSLAQQLHFQKDDSTDTLPEPVRALLVDDEPCITEVVAACWKGGNPVI